MGNYTRIGLFFLAFVFFVFIIVYFVFFRGIRQAELEDFGLNGGQVENNSTEISMSGLGDEGEGISSVSSEVNSGGGSGGTGGSSGGSDFSGVSSGCPLVQIAYAVKDLNVTEECESFFEGACVEKKISCSAKVYNFDYYVSGPFDVNFALFDRNKKDVILREGNDENIVAPRQNLLFVYSVNVLGEEASLEYGCSFETISIPKKEECG